MKNSYIGLMVDDSPGLPIGVLAILKSGNCFVPINPIFPNERVRFIIDDCNISILLTDKVNYEKAGQIVKDTPSVKHIICVDDIAGIESKEVKGEGGADKTPHCYVIYTSGSTGSPKGVPITHGNIAPLFYYSGEFLHLGVHTRVMQNLSYTFDFGVFEMLTTLVFGGRFFVLNKSSIGDFSFAVYFIHRQQINTLHTTPVFLNNLADPGIKIPSIKLIHLGGERLTDKVVKKTLNVISPGCMLWNGYGPTEASINCTFFSLTREEMAANAGENIPIGPPCDRHEIYILDRFLNPQPIGAAGELCIAGPGLSPGYLNRPELTAERFYRSNRSYRTYIIYRTGDLARWLADGNIEFLGRIDHQVKVRGFRIELGEIENSLHKHPGIKEAVVVAREHENGGNYLCAYIVTHDGKPFTISQLREHLTKELPDYMVPAYFIHLERIPLTTNGKIDRKALPGPDETFIDTGVEYAAPGTETEKKLASIWQQLLRLEKIGINADFFHLGGDSILVNRCIARIREALHAEIPLRKFFERPFIKALAEEIEKLERQVSSIKPAVRVGEIPLSFAQERLWFLQELDAGNVAYFVPRVIRMMGKLDVHLIERTFTEIIRRHEILRTTFHTVDGKPVQRIQPPCAFKIPVKDWMGLEKEEQERRILDFLNKEGQRPFDFEHGPLLRVTLLKLTGTGHLFVLTEHHLIHDGWTQGVLLREFIAIFTAYSEGKSHRLPGLLIQYADYAIWQRNYLKGEVLEKHLTYWEEKLSGLPPVLDLPADRPRPPVISGQGALEMFHLSASFSQALKEFSRQNGATLFMTMLAVFKILLYRYSGVEDLCVGTGIANRRYKEMEGMLGMVINTLPLRTQMEGEASFKQCLHWVKETCLDAYQHEDTPFGKIVEVMQPGRSLSYSPLFQVLFSFMDTPGEALRLPGLQLEILPSHNRSAKFDINVVVVPPPEQESEETGEILVEWEYNTDIFDPPTIERMVSHYKRLLEEGLGQPEMNISTLPLMSDAEIKQVLYEFNDTEAVYPREKTIHQLFEEQAARTPDRIAVFGPALSVRPVGPVSLSYSDLDEQSNRLAGLLIEKGVLADNIVGILMERSVEMIIGIMGILKAGGVYMPIDPEYPDERIDYMLKDSGAKIMIGRAEEQKSGRAEFVFSCFFHACTLPRFLASDSSNLAYIIYTSGTTGQPKGSLIEHRNVVRLLFNDQFQFDFSDRDIWTIFHSFCFDFSVWEMYGALLYGGKSIIVPKMTARDTAEFLGLLARETVTVLNQTPSAFYNLLNEDLSHPHSGKKLYLKYVIFGGEALNPLKLKDWPVIYSQTRLINMFGITETTVHVTFKEIKKKDIELNISNIGNPIPTLSVYILNRYLKPVPVGVPGEICVKGKGVGRGYLNRVELTAEKFIKNPYKPGDRLYRSGDKGRFFENGEIEYLGRIDHQVKIRGYRVELGEIENRLLMHAQVKDAVVLALARANDTADHYLCAYFTAEGELEISGLRKHLSTYLPDYMIPSHFISIAKIPLNPNGKIDWRALPEPGVGDAAKECTAPRDAVEKMMAEIWAEVLKPKSPIGIDDNFFDLGGHSLNAALLTTRMHKVFNVKIPLREFLQGGCIREVAEYIKGAVEEKFIFIEPVEEKEYYPLSAAQKRMYILQQMDEESTAYNIPALMTLEGALDKTHLEGVFRQLIRRHESLRTSFITIAGEPVQRIHDHVEFEIEYKNSSTDYTDYTDEKDNKIHHSSFMNTPNHFIHSFDFSQAPLMRVGLAKQEEERHLLMVDMHHIITDGTSMELFVKEFMALYAGRPLPTLKLQYKDYAGWKSSEKEKNALKIQAEYWLKQFREAPPALDLPLDSPRPVVKSFEGRGYSFEITAAETDALKALASAEGTTLYMALLTLYYIFLSRLTGQEEIVVGTPVAGRSHADLEPIMGMFVNTLALRNNPAWEKNFCRFLKEVNENTLAAFANQDYPYEELVEKASVARDTGRNPLFDTMLNLRNMDISEIEITGLKMKPFPFEENVSKFDLTLRAFDAPGNLRFTFEYCSKLFKTETIERFVGFFKAVIARATREPHARIAELEIISEAEKQIILMDFNDTAVDYPRDKTIHGLFEEQVEKAPDRIALSGESVGQVGPVGQVRLVSLTYRQLNERSSHLAGLLIEKGVLEDDIVAIKMARSIELIVGIMGILKSGAAYLPIDPDYPQERIDYMLKDSAAKTLLTAAECVFNFHHSSFIIHHSNHLAYILYTSGSTGRPKGVVVKHEAVVNLLFALFEKYPLNQADCYLLKTTYVFDVSVTELFGWFLGGGRLAILEPGGEKDPQKIIAAVEHSAVTHINFVPSMFNVILNLLNHQDMGSLKSLRYIFMAGEALMPGSVRKFKQLDTGILLENLYGPTESTVYACGYSLSGWNGDGPVPIGTPLANIKLSILDKYDHLQPAGIPGELCISGAGTAVGYLNNPELTAKKFNRSYRTYRTYILYRTGDLARWLNDGNIEFLGRIDQQVKIRGFRIELGEIENRLLKHRCIKEAVVIARDFKGDKIICAYFVPVDEGAAQNITGGAELREFLAQALPDYMIPSFFVRLEKIPLNSSGKVNRPALPEPEIQAGDHYIAPGSLVEEALVEIWAAALGIEKNCISADVNLFELGATSLKLIDVAHKVRELYKKDIRVVTLFRYNTIRSLAQYLEQTQTPSPAYDGLYEKSRDVKIDEGKARMNRALGIMKKKQNP